MIRPAAIIASGTLTSRLLGFLRDAMIAALLGAGPVADAFLAAFQLVNVARRLLGEGALNAALVPAWLAVHRRDGAVAAAAFAGRVLGAVSVAVVLAAVVLGLAMPLVLGLLTPGFVGTATLQLAVDDARLMLPYLAFAGPVTVLMAVFNAQHRFALTAFAPVLFNLALIAVMAILLLRAMPSDDAALLIAVTVGIAGLLQLATLVLGSRADRVATPLRLSFDPEIRRLFGKALPGMVASAGPQLLIVVGAIIASSSPSAVSWLYFAHRLIDLPLGLLGAVMGLALVPQLTRAVQADDAEAAGRAQSRAVELAVGLALPAALGLAVLAQPIVGVLFEHGAFTAADTAATAAVLLWFALGLPAQVLTKTLSPAFFARGDTMAPFVATLKGLAIAAALAFVLGHLFGVGGIAAGIAMGSWSTAVTLIRRGADTFGFAIDAEAWRRLPRIVLAALLMGALLWLIARYVWPFVADGHGFAQAVVLAVLIAGGLVLYAGLLALFGVVRPRDAIEAIRGG